MTDFKPGDVVQLKSGGPAMTVMEPSPAGNLLCVWMAGGDYKAAPIPGVALKLIESPATKPQKQPRRCECAHPLREHNAQGACLHRDEKTRAPCPGPCRIIEAGEE